MTITQSIYSDPGDEVAEIKEMYRRLATLDPPALRSLAVELQRESDESASSATLHATPGTRAKARRDAQRASAARAALSSVEIEP